MQTKLIGYISLGYPTLEESLRIAEAYLASGLDVVEIGYPTDNAFLDNDYIKSTLKKGLENVCSPQVAFEAIGRLRKSHPNTQFILLVYEHGVLDDIGYHAFVTHAHTSGIEDIILVGAKSEKTKDSLMADGFKVSCYVTYPLPDGEVEEARHSNGFVYLQAKPAGETRPGCEALKDCILYLRSHGIENKIYAGVGISTPEDVAMVASAQADGAFIGSALLKQASDSETLKQYISQLRDARDCSNKHTH